MPGGKHTGSHLGLHGGGKAQEPEGVRDLGPATVNLLGELFFGAVEVSQELLVREGFLQGIEVGPVKILQKRITQQGIIIGATDIINA